MILYLRCTYVLQDSFEIRYARMPEEPVHVPSPVSIVPPLSVGNVLQPPPTASASSSDDDSETVRERRLLNLQQQVS